MHAQKSAPFWTFVEDRLHKILQSTHRTTSGIGAVNPLLYRGYYYDTELGMYYLQSRYYDPVVKRFINADSVDYLGATDSALSLNLFAYCENNPVNRIDQDGTYIQYIVGAVVGGVLSLLFYLLDCLMESVSVKPWKAALNFANGALNGIIAASGARMVWQIVASVGASIVSVFAGSSIPSGDELYSTIAVALVSGVISGVVAGTLSKGNNKYISYLSKKFGKKNKSNNSVYKIRKNNYQRS